LTRPFSKTCAISGITSAPCSKSQKPRSAATVSRRNAASMR
jgi:hypothetical protein